MHRRTAHYDQLKSDFCKNHSDFVSVCHMGNMTIKRKLCSFEKTNHHGCPGFSSLKISTVVCLLFIISIINIMKLVFWVIVFISNRIITPVKKRTPSESSQTSSLQNYFLCDHFWIWKKQSKFTYCGVATQYLKSLRSHSFGCNFQILISKSSRFLLLSEPFAKP